jgi:NAD(P)-dependent dehydrogenase (short-subunit alcohol dehydrogenase family)
VTGGTRGIGLAIAQAIVAEGGRVLIAGRHETSVASAVAGLGGDAARAAGFVLDVGDPASAEAMMREADSRFGGFDTLVNNAGIGRFANVADTTDDDWSAVMATNLSGPFYCARAALPYLKRAGGGWIVNIASLAGAHPFAGGGAYCASKAGLIALTDALMQEVRADGIRVSVVLPGSTATEFSGRSSDADAAWKLSPEDVAQAVMDLLRHPSRSLPSRLEIRPARTKPR